MSENQRYENAQMREMMRRLDSNHPFYQWKPFPKQLNVIKSRARIRIIFGANRIGKSESAGHVASSRGIGVDPVLSRHYGKFILHRTPAHVWVVSLDANVSRDTMEKKVKMFLPPEEIAHYTTRDRIFTLTNGSTIGFKSCESGVEKFYGTEMDLIVFDEEPPRDIFDECLMRILACNGSMYFSFTPMKGSQWLHDLMFDAGHLNLAELGIFTQGMGMIDNPTLPRGAIEAAKAYYEGHERDIRVYGIYHVKSAGKVFDADKVKFQMDNRKPLLLEGHLEYDVLRGGFKINKARKELRVFEKPIPNREYAGGGDVGEGNPMGDFSVIQIVDAASLEQVAVWKGRIDPTSFGDIACDLGEWYNGCLIGIEANKMGSATIARMKEREYPKIYAMPNHLRTIKPRINRRTPTLLHMPQRVASQFGWHTNGKTKPIMINHMKAQLDKYACRINDDVTLNEILRYAFLTEDSPSSFHGLGASSGHDDCCEALAIAYQVAQDVVVVTSNRRDPFEERTVLDMLVEDGLEAQIQKALEEEEFDTSEY